MYIAIDKFKIKMTQKKVKFDDLIFIQTNFYMDDRNR